MHLRMCICVCEDDQACFKMHVHANVRCVSLPESGSLPGGKIHNYVELMKRNNREHACMLIDLDV